MIKFADSFENNLSNSKSNNLISISTNVLYYYNVN